MSSTILDSKAGDTVEGQLPIGDQLVAEGKLTQADLDRALLVNENNSTGLGPLLVRLGLVSDRDLATVFAKSYDLPLLGDGDFPDVPIEDCQLSIKFLKEANIIPLATDDDQIVIASADPEDTYILQAVEMAASRPVTVKVASITQIERAFDQLYGEGQSSMDDIVEQIEDDSNSNGIDSIERLKDLAGEAPIIRLVNLIINRAIELRASDIHIEPFENRLKVRYRIDGVLQESEAPPARSTAAVISRIKIMAKMNIAERRLPQDGRIQLRTQGKMIDLRVSTVPTLYGESLVLRVLDKQRVELELDTLGFDKIISAKLHNILSLPHGIILVTGPTGSGKTTTLYAALQTLNTSDKKILTVEDPVEYQLEGINQIQVKPQIGLNFANALRSIVRQDPDVIMIGEIRDLETARIAVQSALTGHLVFSTLHTNDAGSSITRLLDMGVEDYLLTSTLNGILAQRLVRTLCRECREAYAPVPELVEELQLDNYTSERDITLYKVSGCEHCADTGYHGRSVITELMILSEPIRRLILAHADGTKIQSNAQEEGMDTMKIDGLKKALRGITSIEEVTRVTQE
ncbi:MAG: type II secretion system ATPase GspE [Gammaproteobacteria bacterium]|nr:type II secretion system ATPase GspE [Gammaproteobacteria bacterium]